MASERQRLFWTTATTDKDKGKQSVEQWCNGLLVVVLNVNVFVSPLSDESKVFDGASELQLDCMVEESSGSTTVKHDGLLTLTDLSQPDDFHAPPHNGPSLTEMSSPLPVEPSDIKLDPAAGDTPASIGESKVLTLNTVNTQLYCFSPELTLNLYWRL